METSSSFNELAIYVLSAFNQLSSQWKFILMAPVCLLLDSLISYLYIAKYYSPESESAVKKCKTFFWKMTSWKAGYITLTILLEIIDKGSLALRGMVGLFFIYYLYIIIIFIITLLVLSKLAIQIIKEKASKHLDK